LRNQTGGVLPPVTLKGLTMTNFTEEECQQIAEFLSRTADYKKAPCGNQPDEFLLGVMKRPIHDGPLSKKPPLDLGQAIKVRTSYRRKIDES
jgi:hypothetical protein